MLTIAEQHCGNAITRFALQEMNDEGKLGVGGGGQSTKVALNPKKKIPFKLKEKIELSHNTRLFRFALQTPEHRLGLPIGQHMFFYAKVSSFALCFPPLQMRKSNLIVATYIT